MINSKKFKNIGLTLSVATLTTLPTMLVLSCGATSRENLFVANSNVGGKQLASNLGNFIQGTKAFNSLRVNSRFGMSRDSDARQGENEPLEVNERIASGQPYAPGIDTELMWNWIPVEQDYTTLGKSITDPSYGQRFNYGPASGIYGVPDTERTSWDVDGEFNRGTTLLKTRTHGEKLKPTQSAFARFSLMRGQQVKNGFSPLGFIPGMSNNQVKDGFNWQYINTVTSFNPGPVNNIKVPTADEINVAHRNGVPAIGTLLLYSRSSGFSEKDITVMTNPGPNGDYPVAKGLVEYALYHNFDGYFIDWEVHGGGRRDEFLKALLSYSKTGEYTTASGTRVSITDAGADAQIKQARQTFNYGWRPLMVSNYLASEDNDLGDMQFVVQMHGGQMQGGDWKVAPVDAATIGKLLVRRGMNGSMTATDNGSNDLFDPNGAANWPEDALEGTYGIWKSYYKAAADYYKYLRTDLFPGTTKAENMFSNWFWEYGTSDPKLDQELFASYAGDPRIVDNELYWTVSNSYQETTTIIGHNNWATNFDLGLGLNYSLYGSGDIKQHMIGASNTGWKNIGMQSYLPTYRFIIDTFDARDNQTNSLTQLDANGKVIRAINATLNNQSNAWFGGTTLDYNGTLANQGDYFINKLYASNVKLQTDDKFTIKIRNNWGENYATDAIKPELALWVDQNRPGTEYDFESSYYKADGSEGKTFPWANGTSHDTTITDKNFGFLIGNDGTDGYTGGTWKILDALRYEKESAWNRNRVLRTLAPNKVEKVANGSEWLELTYDLSSLAGETMLNFGLKGIAAQANEDFGKLNVGEMKYIADSALASSQITNVKTLATWKEQTKLTQQARITWEDSAQRGDVWNYLVFYINDDNKRSGLAWMGPNRIAYLPLINRANTNQKIEIVAIDQSYNVTGSKRSILPLE